MIEMPDPDEVEFPKLPQIMGHGVSEDENGNICLNDLWAMAQKPKNRRPNDWHRGARAKALDKAVQDGIAEISRKPPKERSKSTHYTIGRGGASKTYARQVLVPELKSGDIVIMDNLPGHKENGVEDAITAAGAHLDYLPAYSPDLNPIQMAFAKLKALLERQPPALSVNSGKSSSPPSMLYARRMPKLP
jgi:hypothetical protein